VVKITSILRGAILMTLLEEDLLTVLKELLETSEVMTSGTNFTAEEMVRYKQSVEWAKRIITLAEKGTN
jgi:hypothetical protein